MLIKDLIEQLTALYNIYTPEDKEIMGEPEIMIDVFDPLPGKAGWFEYVGFSTQIVIEKTDDGVYDILSSFNENPCKSIKA